MHNNYTFIEVIYHSFNILQHISRPAIEIHYNDIILFTSLTCFQIDHHNFISESYTYHSLFLIKYKAYDCVTMNFHMDDK